MLRPIPRLGRDCCSTQNGWIKGYPLLCEEGALRCSRNIERYLSHSATGEVKQLCGIFTSPVAPNFLGSVPFILFVVPPSSRRRGQRAFRFCSSDKHWATAPKPRR